MKRYVFINPDGDADIGIVVIVAAPTGVVYSQQCNGYACTRMEIEGFAVPLGNPRTNDYAKRLIDFFEKLGCGWDVVSEQHVPELQDIVAKIPFWRTQRTSLSNDMLEYLELDMTKLDELVEAWVPVITVYGPGVLTFENCD